MNSSRPVRIAFACAIVLLCQSALYAENSVGRKLYANKCAECHGDRGQGVAGAADDALYGSRSLEDLTKVIVETMPDGSPEDCVGEEAKQVADYIYNAFYTAEARSKSQTARVELARLTVPQYRNTVADLLAGFIGRGNPGDEQGLQAEYYSERRRRRDKLELERIDSKIDFDYGDVAPAEKVKKDEFFIRWDGSLVASESGSYEIIVRTGNGMKLWLNDPATPLIDAWVSSGGKVMEHRATVELLGGRAYPLAIEYFKYRDKSAAIQLKWKPPHKAEEIIPPRHLRTKEVPPTFVVTSPFPPDDRSVGYERGTFISQAWDEATTAAALETMQFVVDHVDRLAGTNDKANDRFDRWRSFCERFVERAFRHPLSNEEKEFYVGSVWNEADNKEDALKRVVLLTLKSPRFLYVGLDDTSPDFQVASRISYALWDTAPDDILWEAAARGELKTEQQVTNQARRMLSDPRAKNKLREFFHEWLMLSHADDLSKDPEAFPGFDEQIISDLRSSLDLMLDEIAWNEKGDFRRVLLADSVPVNKRLAEFYGVGEPEKMSNDRFELVKFEGSTARAGVLTHPYLMAALSYRGASSPIHRGVFLTRNVMNRVLNPPPMAIEFEDALFEPHLTMREKVTEMTKATACQACHKIINPLGFTLENFDAVGRYREREKEKPINAKSDYVTDGGETVTLNGARALAEYAAGSKLSQEGLVESLLHHMVKQPAAAYGEDTLAELRNDFVKAEFSMRELMVDIVKKTALHDLKDGNNS